MVQQDCHFSSPPTKLPDSLQHPEVYRGADAAHLRTEAKEESHRVHVIVAEILAVGGYTSSVAAAVHPGPGRALQGQVPWCTHKLQQSEEALHGQRSWVTHSEDGTAEVGEDPEKDPAAEEINSAESH